MGKKIDWG